MTTEDAMGEDLAGVSRTAIGVARVRAVESLRPDRLFGDPYAQAFVDAAPAGYLDDRVRSASPLATSVAAGIAVRTRFFDTYLLEACASGCRQVVLLAAGLDARAYRLPWPAGVRLYELDLPALLEFKAGVLGGREAVCARATVPVDLRGDWISALRGAGFDPSAPTAWLIEGLLIYLSKEDASALLRAVTWASAPGSQVSFEQGVVARTPALLDRVRQSGDLGHVTSLWQGGLGEDAAPWLNRHGWQARSIDRAEVAVSYGRPLDGRTAGEFIIAVRTA